MSDSSSSPRFSEIEAFWLNEPTATDERVHEFTGEMTKQVCDCGMTLRRFERWNGECELCRRQRGVHHEKQQCGCMVPEGGFWHERHGWHIHPETGAVHGRCAKYWSTYSREMEYQTKVGGKTIKKIGKVRFHIDEENPLKIVSEHYDSDGRPFKMPDYGK